MRDVLLRVCGRVFRCTTPMRDFVSVYKVVKGIAKNASFCDTYIYWVNYLIMKAAES